MPRQATFVDLFSGCGGFSWGLQQAGFRPAMAIDWDDDAVATYRRNFSAVRVIQRDLQQVTRDDVLTALARHPPTLVVSGSPCQGFSTAGRRDPTDPRNSLLLTAGKLAISLKPTVFIAENVAGVIAGTHRRHWDELHALLRSAGYKTSDFRCDASNHGVPQIRRRMLMIAWRSRTEVNFLLPSLPRVTLFDAISNINGAANHQPRELDPSSTVGRIAMHIAPGQKLCNVRGGNRAVPTWQVPDVFGHTTIAERRVLITLRALRRKYRIRQHGDADPVTQSQLSKHVKHNAAFLLNSLIRKGFVRKIGRRFDLTHTFNGKFRRLRWNEPSLTVDTRFGQPRYFLHPDEPRGFTVREAARIQGFPDGFEFTGSERAHYRMIGNAVPPPVAAHIARVLQHVLD